MHLRGYSRRLGGPTALFRSQTPLTTNFNAVEGQDARSPEDTATLALIKAGWCLRSEALPSRSLCCLEVLGLNLGLLGHWAWAFLWSSSATSFSSFLGNRTHEQNATALTLMWPTLCSSTLFYRPPSAANTEAHRPRSARESS